MRPRSTRMKQGSDRLSLPPRQGGWPALAFGPRGSAACPVLDGAGPGTWKRPRCKWEDAPLLLGALLGARGR